VRGDLVFSRAAPCAFLATPPPPPPPPPRQQTNNHLPPPTLHFMMIMTMETSTHTQSETQHPDRDVRVHPNPPPPQNRSRQRGGGEQGGRCRRPLLFLLSPPAARGAALLVRSFFPPPTAPNSFQLAAHFWRITTHPPRKSPLVITHTKNTPTSNVPPPPRGKKRGARPFLLCRRLARAVGRKKKRAGTPLSRARGPRSPSRCPAHMPLPP
jgi:hypothetical protein